MVAAGTTIIGGFVSKGSLGYLENSDLEDGKKLGGAMEVRSRRGQPRPWIEVILR